MWAKNIFFHSSCVKIICLESFSQMSISIFVLCWTGSNKSTMGFIHKNATILIFVLSKMWDLYALNWWFFIREFEGKHIYKIIKAGAIFVVLIGFWDYFVLFNQSQNKTIQCSNEWQVIGYGRRNKCNSTT